MTNPETDLKCQSLHQLSQLFNSPPFITDLFIMCPGLLFLQYLSVLFEQPQKASDLLKISGRVGKLGNQTQLWHFNPLGSFCLFQISAVQDRKELVDSSAFAKGDKEQLLP